MPPKSRLSSALVSSDFLDDRGSVTDMYADGFECPVCGRWIAAGEVVVRSEVHRSVSYRPPVSTFSWEPICLGCAQSGAFVAKPGVKPSKKVVAKEHHPDGEVCVCVTCGWSVILKEDSRRRVPTCSTACRAKHYNQAAVRPPKRQECAGCGDPFEGRADARYCSSACRQRAYRLRTADGPAR